MLHDDHPHLQYCEWLVQAHESDPGFVEHILRKDKASFTHESAFNSQTPLDGTVQSPCYIWGEPLNSLGH
jgi:hypothetical protein